uniref:Mucin 15, cell surface associated n=1 Tax=Sciurus vulgaris TaxID=55149 RepID=A0A8D2BBV4_SCIVU
MIIIFFQIPLNKTNINETTIYEQQNPGKNISQSTAEGLVMMENKSMSFQSEVNTNSDNANRNTSEPKASTSPSKNYRKINSTGNFSIDNFSRDPRPTTTFSTMPPLVHGYISKLILNSSITNKSLLPASAHPINSTHAVSPGNVSWSLDNDTVNIPDNTSSTISIILPAPTTRSETPLIMEPTGWLTTTTESLAAFTPYQEKTTPQPTLKFTNNSKFSSNTSDPQKENRNTGVVFGAILGAILGASLLSLVGYLLCGKRKTDSFSHRRLYDDRNEPVLRLDNAPEPYDVSFGNSSYYNPTVNESSVQESRENARDGIPMDDIPPLRTSV